MCWPPGKAERRYAGVTHLDVAALGSDDVQRVHDLMHVPAPRFPGSATIPIPFRPIHRKARSPSRICTGRFDVAADLGVNVVNSFVGRDPSRSVDEQLAPLPGSLATPHPACRRQRSAAWGLKTARCFLRATNGPG